MPHASSQAIADQLQVLFGTGTCAGLSDAELIERFRSRRDEGGERAFEALVTRHGPMVMGVCRNILKDPAEVHDAFQATFLVLARRAEAIRNRDSVGSWLHGVAVRVAARGRVASIRRQVRDRRTVGAAGTVAAVAITSPSTPSIDRDEGAALVHQELDRLPEKYRAPIVLCYLEGLTHDEAAARLRWPVGTVRSRLSRARDTLRSRLSRRGVTSALDPRPPGGLADRRRDRLNGVGLRGPPGPTFYDHGVFRHSFRNGSVRGRRLVVGRCAESGSRSLDDHDVKKLTVAGCILMSLGLAGVGGGALLVRASRAQEPRPAPAAAPVKPNELAVIADAPIPGDIDPLLRELLEAARKRVEAQRAYYEEGRITIDRFIDGLAHLEKVQLIAARSDADRMAIRRRHVSLLGEIENREKADLEVGRGTVADVSEARQRHLEAEYEMKNSEKEAAEKSAILRRLSELERKVEALQRERTERPAGKP